VDEIAIAGSTLAVGLATFPPDVYPTSVACFLSDHDVRATNRCLRSTRR